VLSSLSESEHLYGANEFYCGRCESSTEADKQWAIQELAPVTVLSFSRFTYDLQLRVRKKVMTPCKIPLELPVNVLEQVQLRHLSSFLCHLGAPTCGHYYSLALHDNTWWKFNDEVATPLTATQFRSELHIANTGCGYMAFYTAPPPPPPPSPPPVPTSPPPSLPLAARPTPPHDTGLGLNTGLGLATTLYAFAESKDSNLARDAMASTEEEVNDICTAITRDAAINPAMGSHEEALKHSLQASQEHLQLDHALQASKPVAIREALRTTTAELEDIECAKEASALEYAKEISIAETFTVEPESQGRHLLLGHILKTTDDDAHDDDDDDDEVKTRTRTQTQTQTQT
jgi:hypothetical protein